MVVQVFAFVLEVGGNLVGFLGGNVSIFHGQKRLDGVTKAVIRGDVNVDSSVVTDYVELEWLIATVSGSSSQGGGHQNVVNYGATHLLCAEGDAVVSLDGVDEATFAAQSAEAGHFTAHDLVEVSGHYDEVTVELALLDELHEVIRMVLA
jgi:hypothetical protein